MPANSQPTKDHLTIMTVHDVAAYLRMSEAKVYRLVKQHRIPVARIGKTWRFRKDLLDAWLIETTDLTEIDVVALSEGQPVAITLVAIPEAALNGVIESISQTYEEKQGDIVYGVTVALDDSHPSLRWGMTAVVTFAED